MNSIRAVAPFEGQLREVSVSWAAERIEAVRVHTEQLWSDEEAIASGLPILVPGFVDAHVHGAAGADFMDGADSAARIAKAHAAYGTTSIFATTVTAPFEDLQRAFRAIEAAKSEARLAGSQPVGAQIVGIHLEGPYISEKKLGAQPDFARQFDLAELDALHSISPIKLLTLAPEALENLGLISKLRERNIVVQLGHSNASYEQSRDALQAGATGVTHLFNAMSGLHHRAPGLAGAALAHARYAEMIPDLLHVHPGALRVALRAIPCPYCVTDATSATSMPDGKYPLGRLTVHKCLGAVRLPDGTLAGSVLTMDQAFRNCVEKLGADIVLASQLCSGHVCEHLGLNDRGRIARGLRADLLVLDRQLRVQEVWIAGKVV